MKYSPPRKQSSFQKLFTYLRPHWRVTLAGILALLVVNIVGTYLPLLIGQAIDELQDQFEYRRVLFYVFALLGMATIMWFIRMASRIWLFGTGRQVEFDLKQQIFEHLLKMDPAYFARNSAGDLISRSTSDVDNIRRLVGFAVLSFVNTIFAYALTLPVMLAIHPGLSLGAISVYPLVLLIVMGFSNQMRLEQLETQEALADLSNLIQEDMSGMAVIKIYAQEDNERQQFSRLNQDLLAANLNLGRTRNVIFPMLGGMVSLSLLILLWFGSRMIAANTIQVGDFVALLLYIERLIFPTALLGFTITAYQRGEVSIDRIEAILAVAPQIQDDPTAIPLTPAKVQGKIEVKHLNYTYPQAPRPALEDVNFRIEPGETVAIVGPIGSGKSTLANALPRLLDVGAGQIFLDGMDITQIRVRDLRACISYVPQDSFLFSTSLKNNIRYGNPQAELPEIETAAQAAQIHREILNFPEEYQTVVGERGITLSGGQRQRTALARALLSDAPILILDDALASVDNQTATQILQNLQSKPIQQIIIFITHQLSAAALAQRILVMNHGTIVQFGTHSELIQTPGLYQGLWQRYQMQSNL